jgi:hypothetical protein
MDFEKTQSGYIVESMEDGKTRKYSTVRAAMNWSRLMQNLPGYYSVWGEEAVGVPHFEGKERRRGMVRLLHEWEAPDIQTSPDVLFINLIGAATQYKFETVYVEKEKLFGEDFRERAKMFQNFVYNKGAKTYLQQPASADDLETSMMIVNSWLHKGLLDIAENSILHKQLKSMRITDLNQLRDTLSAVNALRLAMCGFYASPPPDPSRSNWRRNLREGSWKAY